MDASRYDTFVGNLGMTNAEALRLGSLDGLMLRYSNPDVDGDGVMDMIQTTIPDIRFVFWHEYRYGENNGAAMITNYVRQGLSLPANRIITYTQVRITRT